MLVQLFGPDGSMYQITSDEPAVVGAWFAEWSTRLQTPDARYQPFRICIYPTGDFKHSDWGNLKPKLTESRCRWLRQRFMDWIEEDSAGGD